MTTPRKPVTCTGNPWDVGGGSKLSPHLLGTVRYIVSSDRRCFLELSRHRMGKNVTNPTLHPYAEHALSMHGKRHI